MSYKKAQFSFNPQEIAIATNTYYPRWYKGRVRSIKHIDKIRGDLAIKFFEEAKKRGYCVVAVDGRSSKTFQKEIKNIENIIFIRRRSAKRSPAKRQAIKIAIKQDGIKIIVLTETEKVSLVTSCIPILVKPILEGKADIVVPKRDDKLFASTYPSYMYESEVEGNKIYNEILRVHGFLNNSDEDLDMFFGPRVFRNDQKIISLFMKKYSLSSMQSSFTKDFFDVEDYSNTLYFSIVLGLKKHFQIKSITVPFTYPKIQKENEEKGELALFLEKRKNQRLSILVELLHFVNYLQKLK
ncbi:MAG: hypothetical protein HYV37_02555 [Candidatus Levyibacteriota bacterium]|nr:MAG: hypothetical protein HYV37_02555 [Candidatus Levybacteria bacterium]